MSGRHGRHTHVATTRACHSEPENKSASLKWRPYTYYLPTIPTFYYLVYELVEFMYITIKYMLNGSSYISSHSFQDEDTPQ